MFNPILNADSYKASHYLQYPQGTTTISSYIESRGGIFTQTVFFGLQMFVKAYLLTPITAADIAEAASIADLHGVPFNQAGWQYVLDVHAGLLPISIQALPEGSVIASKNVLVQVRNTDPNCAWLTSYIETALLRAVWYPTTVASLSYACKQIIAKGLQQSADTLQGLPFKLHDFGARGASSAESAAIGGLAHLVNFMGTDTMNAIVAAKRYYHEPMAGFSIPAAEHSTITSWGRDGEVDAYANMLQQFAKPGSLVAVVSDSYDLFNAINALWGGSLKTQVEQSGATLVVRPDSGNPVQIVAESVEALMSKFGYTLNSKGYKVLPACVRVIQGDGINLDSLSAIITELHKRNLSLDNVAFGMGGALLQKVDRDSLQFAMKASAAEVNGQWRDVCKDPITDQGKRSKKGVLALVKLEDGSYLTVRESELAGRLNQLQTVYHNGKLLVDDSFSAIRARAI